MNAHYSNEKIMLDRPHGPNAMATPPASYIWRQLFCLSPRSFTINAVFGFTAKLQNEPVEAPGWQ
jgi:hypothetical protein